MCHFVMKNENAVIFPFWSVHVGAGIISYSFVMAMGSENQELDGMDLIVVTYMK